MSPQEIQERQYNIPYHYLPWEQDGIWRIGRFLWWGFEYLAILNTVLELVGKSLSDRKFRAKVLDFCCGDGRLIVELLARYPYLAIVVGVDISERALAFAKAATWADQRVEFFLDVVTAIQRIGHFDVVIAMEVLEHIPPENLPEIITQLHNALTEDGWLIVSVPTTNIPLNRKHYQHFTLQTLTQILSNRFSLQDVHYVHRIGVFSEWIRRAVINRFFVCNSETWLKLCTWLYNRFVRVADERTGAHMICRFRKAGHDR